jgi:hypothetical protein
MLDQRRWLSPLQTFSITSSSVSRARCGNCFSRRSSPSMFVCGSVLDCLLKRAEPAGARAGESPAGSFELTRMGLSHKSTPPLRGIGGLWHNTSADIVHDASCGPIKPYPRGEIGRALSDPTLYKPKGPSSKTPTRQHRGPWRQPDGAEDHSRPANVCSIRWSRGRPQPFWARPSRAPGDQGTRVSMHASSIPGTWSVTRVSS